MKVKKKRSYRSFNKNKSCADVLANNRLAITNVKEKKTLKETERIERAKLKNRKRERKKEKEKEKEREMERERKRVKERKRERQKYRKRE